MTETIDAGAELSVAVSPLFPKGSHFRAERYEIAEENGVPEDLVLSAPARNDAVLRAFDSRFRETDGRNLERSLQRLLLDAHSDPEVDTVGSDQLLGR